MACNHLMRRPARCCICGSAKKASTKHAGETTQNGEQRMRYCPERRLIPLGLLHVTVLLCGSDTGAGRDLQDKRVLGREKRFLSRQPPAEIPQGLSAVRAHTVACSSEQEPVIYRFRRPHSLTFEYVAPRRRKVKPRNQRRRSGGGEEGRRSNDTHASRARRPLICLISACGGKYDRTSEGANAKTPPES